MLQEYRTEDGRTWLLTSEDAEARGAVLVNRKLPSPDQKERVRLQNKAVRVARDK
jgi:hypothetical protein